MDHFMQIKNVITSLIALATLFSAQSSAEYSESQELLDKLRSFDHAFLHRQTLVTETVSSVDWRDPSQGQKKTKVTLTTDDGAMAVERDILYMSEPSYRKKTKFTEMDYYKDGNLIVWRRTRTHNLLESDFQAYRAERMVSFVSPDGQITEEEGVPLVEFHRPSSQWNFWDFWRPIWATGRGFADSLAKITEINQEQGGIISFRAIGSLGSGTEGTWQIQVEPKAAYLVRSASYTVTGRDSPEFVYTTTGTKWFETVCLAEQASLSIRPDLLPNDITTTKTKQFQPEPDVKLFEKLRGMLRGPLPKNTAVCDFRVNPEEPLRYRVGKPLMTMTDRELLDVIAHVEPVILDKNQMAPEQISVNADTNSKPMDANHPRHDTTIATPNRGAGRYVIFALAVVVIGVVAIGAIYARKKAKN